MSARYALGGRFPSLGARVIYAYCACFPQTQTSSPMDEFLRAALEKVYEQPELAGICEQPDACFASRSILNNRHPELMDAMLLVERKLFDWVNLLHRLGLVGEARDGALIVPKEAWRLTAKTLTKLLPFGISYELNPAGAILRAEGWPGLFEDWTARAVLETEGVGKHQLTLRFLYGMAGGRVFRAEEFFGKFYEDASFLRDLEGFFESLGYTLHNDERGLRAYWRKEYRGKEYGELRIYFRYRDQDQMGFEFRVPGFRRLLEDFDAMDERLQAFCFARMKECDACGYCTQTDKTGGRKPLCMELASAGVAQLKCPLWPRFFWNAPDAEAFEGMKVLFRLAERALL